MKRVLFLVKQYLIYLIQSNNRHGVHSPFAYYINDQILPDGATYYAFDAIEKLRSDLLINENEIKVNDLGAGSMHNNSPKRSIQSITKNTSKSPKIARLLFRLIDYWQPKTSLELGTSMGISTAYIAKARSTNQIISIEGCENISQQARLNLSNLGIENVEVLTGSFDQMLPIALKQLGTIDFVFIDGHHSYAPTLAYYKQLKPYLHKGLMIVLDDIHWSSEMLKAWNEIKQLPEVSVSIDLFDIGILFFDTQYKKQHFVMRYDGFLG
jgi:predicted O-methyltransferase YrrM